MQGGGGVNSNPGCLTLMPVINENIHSGYQVKV